jgi:MFS family permease
LADIVDRRRILIVAQALMLVAAGVLGVATLSNRITTGGLLALSVLLSIGGTLNMPSWVAMTPELVGREHLLAASSLNSISMNLAGALGPAIAGIVIAQAGPGWVFVLNAVSFIGVIAVVLQWKRTPSSTSLPAEHIGAAMFLESFSLATWVEHEREQQRRTNADAALHQTARSHLVEGSEPVVQHFVAAAWPLRHAARRQTL